MLIWQAFLVFLSMGCWLLDLLLAVKPVLFLSRRTDFHMKRVSEHIPWGPGARASQWSVLCLAFYHLSSQKCLQRAVGAAIVKLVSLLSWKLWRKWILSDFSNKCLLAHESRFIAVRDRHVFIEQSRLTPAVLGLPRPKHSLFCFPLVLLITSSI